MGTFNNSIKIINDILTDLINADNTINYLKSENERMRSKINAIECLSYENANAINNLATKMNDIIEILEIEQNAKNQIINRLKD